ncbi:MAG TPA: dienelactone hydrolase family protein, partial [Solirubrobacteraceae bacterium]
GGSHSFLAGASDLDLAGVVGFYGSLRPRRAGAPDVLAQAGKIRGPVLGLFGEADEGIPLDQVAEFEERLGAAGVDAEIVTYPGAPHSFFDRKQEEFAEASADAWRRVLGFLEQVGASVAA